MRKPLPVNSRDVARLAGVSQSTVSKVVNNSASIRQETCNRVIQAARKLGYSLTSHKNGYRVAVIVPEQRFVGYVATMLSGISHELLSKGMILEILPETHLDLLNERCIDGAISVTWKTKFNDEWKHKYTLPLVRINGPSDHMNNCYSVNPDGIASLKKLIDHLWRLGHRKVGLFSFNTYNHEVNNVARRLDGFLQAMQAHGVQRPEEYCLFDCMALDITVLCQKLRDWTHEGMTALIFTNALGTGKMMHCIRLSGLKIPEDISVIGWEQEMLSSYTIPPLSTLSPDPTDLSKAAVSLLLQLITHQPNVHDILLPYRWIERESIGSPS